MKQLPEELLLTAFISADGERAWRRSQLGAALKAMAESEQAILGGELWMVENGIIRDLFPGMSGAKGIALWNTSPPQAGESWADYCRRTYDESLDELAKIKTENKVIEDHQDNLYYHPIYAAQNDLKLLIPRHKHDLARAEAAVVADYPRVAPILPELLEWLQDLNWPVAGVLAPFLASIGSPLAPHLRRVLDSDDEIWKYWIITRLIGDSRELAEIFRPDLERLAESPTESEGSEELDEAARLILEEYDW